MFFRQVCLSSARVHSHDSCFFIETLFCNVFCCTLCHDLPEDGVECNNRLSLSHAYVYSAQSTDTVCKEPSDCLFAVFIFHRCTSCNCSRERERSEIFRWRSVYVKVRFLNSQWQYDGSHMKWLSVQQMTTDETEKICKIAAQMTYDFESYTISLTEAGVEVNSLKGYMPTTTSRA